MTRVVCISVTGAGAATAARLPYEHRSGHLIDTVAAEWGSCDALVLIGATGIAVRAVAPHLSDKRSDPAVVCVDDSGRFAIALTGGHLGGANRLAGEIAAILGATAVVSTATDAAGLPGLDILPGFTPVGDVAGVTRRWLDGDPPTLGSEGRLAGWPAPAALADLPATGGPAGGRVTITESHRPADPGEVLLIPPSVVVGVGASSGADPGGLSEALSRALAGAGLARQAVGALATIDVKAGEPAIVALAAELGVPVVTFAADALAAGAAERGVPNPSPIVAAAVGTPSVAEAAALLAAGPESVLAAAKQVSGTRDSTVALAGRAGPAGHLHVVGLGPGDPMRRTLEAAAAVRQAEVVLGYGPYVDLAADLISPAQEVVRYPIGAETDRCRDALLRAASGKRVALVCSGDPGVYAMASLVCELAPQAGDPPVSVVAGVTAALSGAAVLGAPLGHDHASVSLSDLLTPWPAIAARITAVAESDLVLSLYNPRSQRRRNQLDEAIAILRAHRPVGTPAAVLTDIGRPTQRVVRTTLDDLDPEDVDMWSLVMIGSSQTRWIAGRMVTPRGYREAP